MGTELQSNSYSYIPGYYLMTDLNEDENGYNNWPLHYRDRPLPNGQFYNCFCPSAAADSCIDYDKDAVKLKMLEHEAIFRKQVYELHRLYRIQRDLMDEIRQNELVLSPLDSRSFFPEDARMLQSSGFLSNFGRPSISGFKASCYPIKSLTGHHSLQSCPFQPQMQNCYASKVPERLESRPLKVRSRMFDLTLPADKCINHEELEPFKRETYDRENGAVADLNQPIYIDDNDTPVYPRAHSLFDGKILGKDPTSKSQCGSSDGTISNRHRESDGGGRGWLSHDINAGRGSGDPKHALQSKIHEIPVHLPAHTLDQHKVSLTSDWAKSDSHPLSAWERPYGSSTQNSVSLKTGSCLDLYSIHHTNFQPPPLGHVTLRERWHQSGGRPDSGLRNKSPYDRSGLFPVSSSLGPKGMSNRSDDRIDIKPSAAVDLNRVLSDGGESQEDRLAVLPWLRAKTSKKDEMTAKCAFGFEEKIPFQSPTNQLTRRTEFGECSGHAKILGIPIFGESPMPKKESSSLTGKSECEVAESGKTLRMLDINLPCDQVHEESDTVPEELLVQENKDSKISGLKCEIDLNSCADEDETFTLRADGATGRKISVVIDLEAPVCPEMEEEISSEDEKHIKSPHWKIEHPPDETTKIAAEAIVAISSAVPDLLEPSSDENLMWFASIALKQMQVQDLSFSLEGIDYFESMTLKLTEMKDEEHFPLPLVPVECLEVREEDSMAVTSAASRRPQRRGRQKRDFRRDILPGLISLSRHEVMEDMQTFGGLMQATGHPWNCWPIRGGLVRNRLARPRKRRKATGCPSPSVPSTAYTPPVNLTGWGNTRRPRRQRCPAPAGNPLSIQLT